MMYAFLVVIVTWLGYGWGVPGVSVGVSLAICLNWFLGLTLSKNLLQLSWGDVARVHIAPIVFGLLTMLATWMIRSKVINVLPQSPFIALFVTVGVTLVLLIAL